MATPDGVTQILARFAFPTAVVFTSGGQVRGRWGDTDEVFPFASVTKPIVAWSALIAVERGLLTLEDPAGSQLPGATIRHLLAHASGVAFDSDTILGQPGTRRVYSNRGIEILGERLEDATGMSVGEWTETTVLEPLGMASVLIPGSPAYSGSGSAEDLAIFARELAAPTLVTEPLATQARTVTYPGLGGVLPGYGRQNPNDFGLGVEIRGAKQPHWTGSHHSPATFGHFGQAGSFIWVDPVAGCEAVFLGVEPFGPQHQELWPVLNDALLALAAA